MANPAPILTNPFVGWTTIEEAAEIVGRDNSTIRRWADRGYITCFLVGRKMRVVNLEQVRAYSSQNPAGLRPSQRKRILRLVDSP